MKIFWNKFSLLTSSIIDSIVSLFIYFDKSIRKNKDKKKAKLVIEVMSKNKGIYILQIKNIGEHDAQNIRIGANNLNEKNGFVDHTFNKINNTTIFSNDSVKVRVACSEAKDYGKGFITLIWDDKYKKNNTCKFNLDI